MVRTPKDCALLFWSIFWLKSVPHIMMAAFVHARRCRAARRPVRKWQREGGRTSAGAEGFTRGARAVKRRLNGEDLHREASSSRRADRVEFLVLSETGFLRRNLFRFLKCILHVLLLPEGAVRAVTTRNTQKFIFFKKRSTPMHH